MKRIYFNRFGAHDVLELAEVAEPTPKAGEVRVRVRAAGVNLADVLMRSNAYVMTPQLPATPGMEVAGEIESIGPGVEGLRVGQRVAAALFASGELLGGYAELIVIDAHFVVPVPDDISDSTATALMVQGLTALYMTRQVSPQGKTVLVTAAAGGVGSLLVQLAKREGASRVVGASSGAKRENVLALGADAAVDYNTPGWSDSVREALDGRGPDLIYESTGRAVTDVCRALLEPRGEIVLYGAFNAQSFVFGAQDLVRLIFANQSLTGFALAPLLDARALRSGLEDLFEMTRRGALNVHIGGTYPLERAADAHRALESRTTVGKLVIAP